MAKILLCLLAFAASLATASKSLCAQHNGAYIGLAVDEDSYESVHGQKATKPDNDGDHGYDIEQAWKLVDANKTLEYDGIYDLDDLEDGKDAPHGSLAGKYLQVLPIKNRLYPSNGHVLSAVEQLFAESPYVSFKLHVDESNVGFHTAFIRWAGGNKEQGGSDSLFVVMVDGKGGVVSGQRTLRPQMTNITDPDSQFTGCCYHHHTHFCECFREFPTNETCDPADFYNPDAAAHIGVQCEVGEGVMEFIQAPKWYLYAGSERGKITDFNSEPWDATCEAEGSNTMDSGKDFSMWDLAQAGDYELRIYAREDGTALDGVYVSGPNAAAPSNIDTFGAGDSTFCPDHHGKKKTKKGGSHWFLHFVFWAMLLGGLGYFVTKTEQGRELVGRAQILVESLRGGGSSQIDSSRYEPLGMNPN